MSVKPEYQYPEKIVIGTRGSPLALVQAHMVRDFIAEFSQNIEIEVKIIMTSGDWKPGDGEVRLEALAGGKAQFAKEIEEALLAGVVDIAVHSMKDMETDLPEGLVIPFMLPREDVRDAFISDAAGSIEELPDGAVVGTVSVRRQAFLLNKRPDLTVVPLRGNVQTRLDKLAAGQVDATFLACAGLNRLGLSDVVTAPIDVGDMLPSVGQGAVGIEIRRPDMDELSFIGQFACEKTYVCVECERGVLRSLGGSCRTPVGVYAVLQDGVMSLSVAVISPDGKDVWTENSKEEISSSSSARAFGERVGRNLKSRVSAEVLAVFSR